jgi:hypothetical protein
MAEQDRFALDVIRRWPGVAREAAYNVLLAHGAPDHLDDDAVRWDGVGCWKRVVVCAGAEDDDPDDVVESVIDATIPEEARDAVEEIAGDWHVHVEDDGELAVRGPDLKANVLTLNVVHCMVHDGLTPEQARERRALQLAELRDGRPPDDIDELHFAAEAPHGEPQTMTAHAQRDVVAAEYSDEVGNST